MITDAVCDKTKGQWQIRLQAIYLTPILWYSPESNCCTFTESLLFTFVDVQCPLFQTSMTTGICICLNSAKQTELFYAKHMFLSLIKKFRTETSDMLLNIPISPPMFYDLIFEQSITNSLNPWSVCAKKKHHESVVLTFRCEVGDKRCCSSVWRFFLFNWNVSTPSSSSIA